MASEDFLYESWKIFQEFLIEKLFQSAQFYGWLLAAVGDDIWIVLENFFVLIC